MFSLHTEQVVTLGSFARSFTVYYTEYTPRKYVGCTLETRAKTTVVKSLLVYVKWQHADSKIGLEKVPLGLVGKDQNAISYPPHTVMNP